MKEIYFDNAATTKIDPEVLDLFAEEMRDNFGNPSSIHSKGRSAKAKLEAARKMIAKLFSVQARQIIFTSGGTEANNLALKSAVYANGVKRIVSSELEHPSVKTTINELRNKKGVEVHYLSVDPKGVVDLEELQSVLAAGPKTLVSLMHANNELGNLIDLVKVGGICSANGALFHSDTVQSIAHYNFDLNDLPVDFVSCSAHKIHGPKGVGFLIVNRDHVEVLPLITGGGQERGVRSGTENVAGITAMAEALRIAYDGFEKNENHLLKLRSCLISTLKSEGVAFEVNGSEDCLNNVVSIRLLEARKADMLLFQLDLAGLYVSGGSACSSGSLKGSAVLSSIGVPEDQPSLRFSFSRENTLDEVKEAVNILKSKLA